MNTDVLTKKVISAFEKICKNNWKSNRLLSELSVFDTENSFICHFNFGNQNTQLHEVGYVELIKQVELQEEVHSYKTPTFKRKWIYSAPIKHQNRTKYFLVSNYHDYNNLKFQQMLNLISMELSYRIISHDTLESLFLQSKYQRQIGKSLSEGYMTLNNLGNITYINQNGEAILGLTEQEVIGKDFHNVFTDFVPSPLDTLDTGDKWINREIFIKTPIGKLHLVFSVTPLFMKDDGAVGLVMIFREIKMLRNLLEGMVGGHPIYHFKDMTYKSSTMHELVTMAKAGAKTESIILIEGESGTGKELIAQSIHNESPRSKGPFVIIDCSSIPRDLVESELFGYVDGAFTGASKGGRIGKFELANGGTVFLDEIGEMPLDIQTKLLRVIQSRSITRVAGHKSIPVNIRIIAATNRNLEEEVQSKNFRLDLYYRLNVVYLSIPSLKERAEDIPLLVNLLVVVAAKRNDRIPPKVSPEVMDIFRGYAWPGNIRELENIIERAILLSENQIELDHLPDRMLSKEICSKKKKKELNIFTEPDQKDLKNWKETERELIMKALQEARWNKSVVAKNLGISRSTLYEKLRRYNLS